MKKSRAALRSISEAATELGVSASALRFWESQIPQIKPVQRSGNRRFYRPEDILLLGGIKRLLHDDGMTIKRVCEILQSEGVNHVRSLASEPAPPDVSDKPARQLEFHPIDDIGEPPVPEKAAAEPNVESLGVPDHIIPGPRTVRTASSLGADELAKIRELHDELVAIRDRMNGEIGQSTPAGM